MSINVDICRWTTTSNGRMSFDGTKLLKGTVFRVCRGMGGDFGVDSITILFLLVNVCSNMDLEGSYLNESKSVSPVVST